MRLLGILIMLFICICLMEEKINKVNNNLEKIIKLMELKGEVK